MFSPIIICLLTSFHSFKPRTLALSASVVVILNYDQACPESFFLSFFLVMPHANNKETEEPDGQYKHCLYNSQPQLEYYLNLL